MLTLEEFKEVIGKKAVRGLNWEVEVVLNPKNWITPKTAQEWRDKISIFTPRWDFGGKTIYLGTKAAQAKNRIVSAIYKNSQISEVVTYGDIYRLVKARFEHWASEELRPENFAEIYQAIFSEIDGLTDEHTFMYKVLGCRFEKGLVEVKLGGFVLKYFDTQDLPPLDKVEWLDEVVLDGFKDSLVVLGTVRGSPDRAKEVFLSTAKLHLSSLNLCVCIAKNLRFPAHQRIRIVDRFESEAGLHHSFGWNSDQDLSVSSNSWKAAVKIDSEVIQYLNNEQFFETIGSIIENANRGELDQAIVQAIYWFGEACGDDDPTMQFVKLWICVEVFFGDKLCENSISESVAIGMGSMLIAGGYKVYDTDSYEDVRARYKDYQGLRSRVVHQGKGGHVSEYDLDLMFHDVGWLVVTAVASSRHPEVSLASLHEWCREFDARMRIE